MSSEPTINTPNGPAPEPTGPAIVAELLLTASDEVTLRRLALAARVVAQGAALYISTAPPWQLRVTQGDLDEADWRAVMKNLVEFY